MRRAVFLDRDGTLNKQVGYCGDPAKIELLPGAAEGVRRINELGWLAIVVTNQSAVARGLISEAQVRRVNAEVALQIARVSGGRLDAFYYCPHHPNEGQPPYRAACDCRKPLGGMLLRAAREFELDLAQCVMIGDADIDHQAAKHAHPKMRTWQLPGAYNTGTGDEQAATIMEALARL